ncbi:hypothetical protein HGP17_10745 [Rhizobium sp. P38BS-XIX]|uniref:hypothetical protein n=1 Tax=Rhizobium sp. P38BS-XIX TaxID=2726740 RepID=UPI0014579011|nr:hypothetical protein [Rhizobium sp. P38BS-XIX]NLR97307.1 hypothetical protein [Rhizobium sp. P38BS-XIX]
MDDLREDLKDQRAALEFFIEQAKRHLSELESGLVKITPGGGHKFPDEVRQIIQLTQLYVDHFASEIDTLNETIVLIGHQLEHIDSDNDGIYRSFRKTEAFRRLRRMYSATSQPRSHLTIVKDTSGYDTNDTD